MQVGGLQSLSMLFPMHCYKIEWRTDFGIVHAITINSFRSPTPPCQKSSSTLNATQFLLCTIFHSYLHWLRVVCWNSCISWIESSCFPLKGVKSFLGLGNWCVFTVKTFRLNLLVGRQNVSFKYLCYQFGKIIHLQSRNGCPCFTGQVICKG